MQVSLIPCRNVCTLVQTDKHIYIDFALDVHTQVQPDERLPSGASYDGLKFELLSLS